MSLTRRFHEEKFMTVVERHDTINQESECNGLVSAEISIGQVRDLNTGLTGVCGSCDAKVAFSMEHIAKEVEDNAQQIRTEMNRLFDCAREMHVQAFVERGQEIRARGGKDHRVSEFRLVHLVKEVARTIRHCDERQFGNMESNL